MLHEDHQTFFLSYLAQLSVEIRYVLDRHCTASEENTFCVQHIFFEIRAVCEIMWKHIAEEGGGQVTDDNMAHAHCMLDK